MQITAVILAGGRGSRMGGVDKGLVAYQGQPMIAHALARLRPQVAEILINANRNIDTYQHFGHQVINDLTPDFDGPLAGMQAALHHTHAEWLLSAPCDSPHLPADLAYHLSQGIQQHAALLAIARSVSGVHPVFCLMHQSLRASLDAFLSSGQRKVSAWQTQQKHIFVNFKDEQAFTNINQLPIQP